MLVVVLLSGCGWADGESGAEAAVTAWHSALADGDPAAACHLLAPSTRAALEQDSGQPCAQALAAAGLRPGAPVKGTTVWGRAARAQTGDDVMFLSVQGDRWVVSDAGCELLGDLPADCMITGG